MYLNIYIQIYINILYTYISSRNYCRRDTMVPVKGPVSGSEFCGEGAPPRKTIWPQHGSLGISGQKRLSLLNIE